MIEQIDLEAQSHRPWPAPDKPWMMFQSWQQLLFMHWPIPADLMRKYIPASLALDTFEGEAWIAVVPFRMSGIRHRSLPVLPWASEFPELNVRTYVTCRGKPGVFFFSLDAADSLAVWGAQTFFHLPYYRADITCQAAGAAGAAAIHYDSVRRSGGQRFTGTYRPIGPVYTAQPGSLEHWLTERYCLYAVWRGNAYRGEIHHMPWPLQRAEASIQVNTVLNGTGIVLPDTEPLLHYADRIDVVVWPLEKVMSYKEMGAPS